VRLDEIMTKPVPYRWKPVRFNRVLATFVSKGINYQVDFDLSTADNWTIAFFDQGDGESKGSPFEVITTVAEITLEFIKNKYPRRVLFTGLTPSHTKLYAAIAAILQPKLTLWGYVVNHRGKYFRIDLTSD